MFEMQNGKDTGGLNVINCHENNATDWIVCQFEYYEDINYIKGGKFLRAHIYGITAKPAFEILISKII